MRLSTAVGLMAWALFFAMIAARFFGLVEWDVAAGLITVMTVCLAVVISIIRVASSPAERERDVQ
jgi:hypothetical protein